MGASSLVSSSFRVAEFVKGRFTVGWSRVNLGSGLLRLAQGWVLGSLGLEFNLGQFSHE